MVSSVITKIIAGIILISYHFKIFHHISKAEQVQVLLPSGKHLLTIGICNFFEVPIGTPDLTPR